MQLTAQEQKVASPSSGVLSLARLILARQSTGNLQEVSTEQPQEALAF